MDGTLYLDNDLFDGVLEFLEYIKSQFDEGMTLENYGHKGECWNIDHKIPICTAQTDDDLERLNHYTNLRPMWASDNYKRPRKTP